MSDMNNPADDNNGAMDDLWAEALSEQKSTSSKSAADGKRKLTAVCSHQTRIGNLDAHLI
ncbi:hypothetical protein EFK65_18875 [Escherichia coli]|nr:hypothetical protein [Escherichia coli]